MKNRSLLSLTFLLFAGFLFANKPTSYQKAWNAFLKNDRKTARIEFQEAVKNPQTKADAMLSLSFLDWMDQKEDNAFADFQNFYQTATNPYPYLYGLFSMPFTFASREYIEPERLAFLEKLTADAKMNGTLKAMIDGQLGNYYMFTNDKQKSDAFFDKIGSIKHWQVLGSFDNTSGSGFSKDWGAVEKPLTSDVFENKIGANVKWYTPPYNKPDNWFYFDYYYNLNSAIMYAQSFVKSPSDQEVYLRVGTSGSLKVWINDALVAAVPEERNCDLDIYAYKIKLNQGTNRVLVQIGQSEISAANFLLRFTDAEGHPIQGLSDESTYTDYSKEKLTATAAVLPFFAESYLEEQVKLHPDNYLNYLVLAETYLRNDKAFEATEVLKRLDDFVPNSSLVSYRLSEAYARSKNQTDFDKESENIKRNDPESFIALQELYNDAMRSEKYSEAMTICDKAKQLYGDNQTIQGWEVGIASYQKRIDDVMSMVKKLYAQYPYSYDYMYVNWVIENNVSKNSPQATSIVEDYCKKYFSPKALGMLADIYMEQGKTDEAIQVMKQRIANMPYATGYLDNLSSTYYQMQRYNDALSTTDSILALSPYLPGVFNTRGYIYKGMKDTEKAKENFAKSIYYGPTSYDSRFQLRLLENKKEVFDLFPKTDLKAMIAQAPAAQTYPEDNSLLILNNNQLVVYKEGAKEYHTEIAVKIFNQSGIDTWKEYDIDYNNNTQKLIVDKAEVLKASGSVAKAETNDNQIVFTNLEVGDVLHLDYRIQDFSTGKLADQFFDNFAFRYTIPSLLNRYSILTPKDQKFNYLVENGSIQPTISDVEGMKLYSWESVNQPAVKTESYMSAVHDIVPTLFYTSIPDWRFVSHWYKDLTTSKFRSDYVLKETLETILKGHENDSPLQKAKLFYEYILTNISYSSVSFMHSNFVPQKASRTITTRLGDCKDVSTLFVALCRESGIDANLVLISTRDNGQNQLTLPTINFNHCIAQLNVDGKTYYLELTDPYLPFGAAETSDLQSNILPIPFNGDSIGNQLKVMDMPFRQLNATQKGDTVSVTGDDYQITHNSSYYASIASSARGAFRNMGDDDRLKSLSQAIAGDFSVPVKVSDLSFTNMDNLSDSVTMTCKIDVKKAMQEVAGMKVLNLPWSDKQTSLEDFSLEKRTTPFEFWSYKSDELNTEHLKFILPQGMAFVEMPKDVHLECANATFDMTFKKTSDGNLIGSRIFRRKTDVVTPEQYPAFREFMTHVSEADNKQYAIK